MQVNEFWTWLGDSWMVVAFLLGAIILGSRAWGPIKSFLSPWSDSASKRHYPNLKSILTKKLLQSKNASTTTKINANMCREHVNQMLEAILKKLDKPRTTLSRTNGTDGSGRNSGRGKYRQDWQKIMPKKELFYVRLTSEEVEKMRQKMKAKKEYIVEDFLTRAVVKHLNKSDDG